ncbi:MAG: nickel pincer cofactor biosynthesis protein LarC [Thermoanaerobaculales bacterium]|nr:nickel pincer cofactor biosynthesis protein LarC [Thermoanaerobaculales bacterium]
MSRRILYLDCAGGVAGDMLLSALTEAAKCETLINNLPDRLGFDDVRLEWPNERPGGFAARRLEVHFDPDRHPRHRNYADVCSLIDRVGASADATTLAKQVFRKLAEAEGAVHGRTPDQVHFHEVGAVDAVVDILGAAMALDQLQVDEVICSPLPMGHGTVDCAHGTMPLPAPAVAAMLRGVPVRPAGIEGETVTPTGAALVTTLAARFEEAMPTMTVEAVGVGAGSRSYPGLPNVVRAFVGRSRETPAVAASDHTIVECNVDDLDPRVLPVIIDHLLESGALDAYITPLVMKKGRPGHLISALTPAAKVNAAVDVLLRETTSLGCRSYPVTKYHLSRRMEKVVTPWGEVAVKTALDGERVLRRVPEFEDCAELARRAGVPVRDVLAAAAAGLPEDDDE